jgi:predicted AAA+ superfamily ATPase
LRYDINYRHPMVERYLSEPVKRDLSKKMVLIAGPRQVGKTTFALQLAGGNKGYLNWDVPDHRERILRRRLPSVSLWVFDELHKYRMWRGYLKGLYDVKEKSQRILVTGSARLDYYRFGGDSLQGRYYFWRLHPLSAAELKITRQRDFMELLALGGFPEPFFSGSETDSRRWSREYRTRLIQDDLLTLEHVKDVGNLELLMLRLPELAGAPLSINALREDLQVNHRTVERWIEVLERLYAVFRIPPFGAPMIRAVKKERKCYHYDWTLIKDKGKRFENCVACHLLKWVHYQQDAEGKNVELRYFRDVDRREIDFVIVEDGKPVRCIECKWNDTALHPALHYFKKLFPACEAVQITAAGSASFSSPEGIRLMPAVEFLATLV